MDDMEIHIVAKFQTHSTLHGTKIGEYFRDKCRVPELFPQLHGNAQYECKPFHKSDFCHKKSSGQMTVAVWWKVVRYSISKWSLYS